MKKVFLAVAASAFFLASCGPSICDCVNNADDKDVQEKCEKKFDREDMSDEEEKEMMKEVEECMKDAE